MADGAAVLEVPVESTSTGGAEAVQENTLETTQPEKTQTEPVKGEEKTDGRRAPDAIRKTLKSLRDNPETAPIADEFGKALNERKAFRNFFPKGVGEARETRQAIDAIGGLPKLAELQTYAGSMREVDDMLESGDPRVVDRILETGPKGIVKILPALLEKLAELDPQGMGATVRPQAIKFMENEGVPDAIDGMVAAFNDPNMKPEQKLAEMQRILRGMVNWYKGLGAEKSKQADPQQEAWQKEKSTWEQTRYTEQIQAATDNALTHAESKIMGKLKGDAQKLGADAELTDIWLKDIWKIIESKRNSDPFFMADRDAKFNGRTKKVDGQTAAWLNGFTDKYFDDAYQRVMGPRLKTLKSQPAAEKKAEPTVAPRNVAAEVDVTETLRRAGSRDAMRDMLLQGKAFAKGGKAIVKAGRVWKFA